MSSPHTLTTRFSRRRTMIAVTSLEHAWRAYAELRDRSGAPSSRSDDGIVKDRDGKTVAIVSYNGRVWGQDGWRPGAMPIVEAQIAGSGR